MQRLELFTYTGKNQNSTKYKMGAGEVLKQIVSRVELRAEEEAA